jgi:protein SCO1
MKNEKSAHPQPPGNALNWISDFTLPAHGYDHSPGYSHFSGSRLLSSIFHFSFFTFHFKIPPSFRIMAQTFLLAALFLPTPLLAAPPPLPDNSLYHLESQWTRDDGQTMRLAELRGKTRVLSMFFSQCDNICPMLTGQLKLLDRELPADLRNRIGFVLITIDPEGDDAETLAEHRKRMAFPAENWILLQGRGDDTRELANLLGVTYKPKKNDGQIDHNGLIVVLDAEGRIVEKTSGIKDRKAFLALLQKTVKAAGMK